MARAAYVSHNGWSAPLVKLATVDDAVHKVGMDPGGVDAITGIARPLVVAIPAAI